MANSLTQYLQPFIPASGKLNTQFFFVYILAGIGIAMVAIFFYIFFAYKYFLVYIIPRADGYRVKLDLARLKKNKKSGLRSLRPLFLRQELKAPDTEDCIYTFGKREFYMLVKMGDDNYHPLKVGNLKHPLLQPIPESVNAWASMKQQEKFIKYQKPNPWLTNLPMFAAIGMFVVVGFFMWMIMRDMQPVAAAFKEAAKAIAEANVQTIG